MANGSYEQAIQGVEYYSPDQQGGSYGIVYRQYFGADLSATSPDLTSATIVTRLMDYCLHVLHQNNRVVARGLSTNLPMMKAGIHLVGASGPGDLVVDMVVATLVDGWVDYTR